MKKLFSIFLMATMAMGGFAKGKVYFCDPASANAKAQGMSWEDAVTVASLRKALNGSGMEGDTIYIKGGTIKINGSSDLWNIKASVTLVGGLDPALTGKTVVKPFYPSSTPTIFDGDANTDGKPSKGDAKALIRVDFSADTTKVITLQGLNLVNTYYDDEESPNDEKTAMNECAALRIIRGTAFVKNCLMYNHVSPNNRGSQCVTVVGGRLHMMDCELHDGTSLTRGGLLRLRQYFVNDDTLQRRNPDCVLERCCFYNGNSMAGTAMYKDAKYGGAVQVSYGPIFIINCTFADNMTYMNGAGVNANKSGISVISSTFVNNISAAPGDETQETRYRNTYGSAFRAADNGPIRVANTFALDDKDNGTKTYALMYSDGNSAITGTMPLIVNSAGYNVLGTFFYYCNGSEVGDQSDVWKETDKWTVVKGAHQEHFADYFGTNTLAKNGGFSKTVMPLAMQNGDNVAHLQELADAWCPSWTKVDASLDQRGAKRDANVTCVGAAAFESEAPMGLENPQSPISNLQSSIYNILGQPVGDNYKGIVIQKGKKYLIR